MVLFQLHEQELHNSHACMYYFVYQTFSSYDKYDDIQEINSTRISTKFKFGKVRDGWGWGDDADGRRR
jgi:hypothetical protein